MSVLEADDYQSERELLQPKSYNTFDYSRNQKKKKGNQKEPFGLIHTVLYCGKFAMAAFK